MCSIAFQRLLDSAVPVSTLLAVATARTPWLSAWVQPGTSICLVHAVPLLRYNWPRLSHSEYGNTRTTRSPPQWSRCFSCTSFRLVGLSALWNKTFARNGRAPIIDVDDALIASNVCIGGASTASAMAFSIGKLDLMIPASIFGVVGYLLGTPVGLWVHNKL